MFVWNLLSCSGTIHIARVCCWATWVRAMIQWGVVQTTAAQSLAVPAQASLPLPLAPIDATPIHTAWPHFSSWDTSMLLPSCLCMYSFQNNLPSLQLQGIGFLPETVLTSLWKLFYPSYIINVPQPSITLGFLPCLHDICTEFWTFGCMICMCIYYMCVYICIHACRYVYIWEHICLHIYSFVLCVGVFLYVCMSKCIL